MIWLKKVRNDRLYDGKFDVAVFLQQMMEPFEEYMKSIRENELSYEIIRNAQFHPPECQKDALKTVISQCEMWTDNVADFEEHIKEYKFNENEGLLQAAESATKYGK